MLSSNMIKLLKAFYHYAQGSLLKTQEAAEDNLKLYQKLTGKADENGKAIGLCHILAKDL